MFTGTTVLCSRAEGFKEIVKDKETGMLVNVDEKNYVEAEKALLACVNGEVDLEKMAIQAFKDVSQKYSWNKSINDQIRQYEAILQ